MMLTTECMPISTPATIIIEYGIHIGVWSIDSDNMSRAYALLTNCTDDHANMMLNSSVSRER